MSLNESTVEDAALEWFGELGYSIGHGPHIAPGEPAAERDSFGEVVLVGRLREAIRRLNLAIPEEAREEALRKVLRVGTPSLTQTNRAFHRMLRDGVPVEYPRPDDLASAPFNSLMALQILAFCQLPFFPLPAATSFRRSETLRPSFPRALTSPMCRRNRRRAVRRFFSAGQRCHCPGGAAIAPRHRVG